MKRLSPKVLFVILIFFGFSFNLPAQDSVQKVRVYVGAFYSAAGWKTYYPSQPFSAQDIQRFIPYRAGIDIKVIFSQHVGFTTGFLVESKNQIIKSSVYDNNLNAS